MKKKKNIKKEINKKVIITILTIILITPTIVLLINNSNSNKVSLPLTATVVSKEDAVAKISYAGKEIYVDNFTDAWFYANEITDQDVELTLYTDWVADNGSFGSGTGYGSTGNLTPVDRDKESIKLTIDLNGHTIDRNLDTKVKSGNVISIKKDGVYTIKNGTITGGNTTDRGGALWLDNKETTVNLENVKIIDNHADGNGGGIFVKKCSLTLNITDTTITNNSSNNYGGGIYISEGDETVNLLGVVVVKDNTGKNNRNNVTLQQTTKASFGSVTDTLNSCTKLEKGSKIYIAPSNFNTDAPIADKANEETANYFASDNSKAKIVFVVDSGQHHILKCKTKE